MRIRSWSVDRFKPSRAAAPRRPASTQRVTFQHGENVFALTLSRVPRTCLCSESSSMSCVSGLTLAFAIGALKFNSDDGTRSTGPGDRIAARSIRFCSSRMLPGQVKSGQSFQGWTRNRFHALANATREVLRKMPNEQRDTFRAFPQGRDLHEERICPLPTVPSVSTEPGLIELVSFLAGASAAMYTSDLTPESFGPAITAPPYACPRVLPARCSLEHTLESGDVLGERGEGNRCARL